MRSDPGSAVGVVASQPGVCAAGEPDFDALIERFRGALIGFLSAHGAREPIELAEDVFAEAWLGRERFRGTWDDDGAVGAWLRGIALNLHRAESRRRAPGPRLADDALEPAASESVESDDVRRVRVAIERLPARLRAPLVMHHLERTPVRRVAALLGVSEKTAEGRLYRARRELGRIVDALERAEERR